MGIRKRCEWLGKRFTQAPHMYIRKYKPKPERTKHRVYRVRPFTRKLVRYRAQNPLPCRPRLCEPVIGDLFTIYTYANQYRTKLLATNSSGYIGVSFIPRAGKWLAAVESWGLVKKIGTYDEPDIAALARDLYVLDILRPLGAVHTLNAELGLISEFTLAAISVTAPLLIGRLSNDSLHPFPFSLMNLGPTKERPFHPFYHHLQRTVNMEDLQGFTKTWDAAQERRSDSGQGNTA